MRKKYIVIGLIGLVIIIASIIVLARPKNKLKVTLIPKDYHHLYSLQEEMAFDVELLVNDKNSVLTTTDNFYKSYLEGQDETYLVEIVDIKDLEKIMIVKGEKFYKYNFHCVLISELENDVISLNNARLSIQTLNMDFSFIIGDITLKKVPSFGSPNNELAISYLKGQTIEEKHRKRLSGVVIGLRNNSQNTINITNIEMIASGVNFSNEEKIELIDQNINNLNINYNLYSNYSDDKVTISLFSKETKYFLLPIKYEDSKLLSRCGIKIDYENGGVNQTMYFDDFIFFSENIFSQQILDNLTIYQYGNN